MPKKRRSSGWGPNDFKKTDKTQNGLAALASDVVKSSTAPQLEQDVILKSVRASTSLRAATPTEGPLEWGIAEASLTVTEIAEALDAAPTHKHDIPATEHAARRVRSLGTFPVEVANEISPADGTRVFARLNWRVAANSSFPQVWTRNRSGAVLTTGAIVENDLIYHCKWLW